MMEVIYGGNYDGGNDGGNLFGVFFNTRVGSYWQILHKINPRNDLNYKRGNRANNPGERLKLLFRRHIRKRCR